MYGNIKTKVNSDSHTFYPKNIFFNKKVLSDFCKIGAESKFRQQFCKNVVNLIRYPYLC